MPTSLFDTVTQFLEHLGCQVERRKDKQIIGTREVVGSKLTFVIRVEDRGSMSQMPTASVYAKRFEAYGPLPADAAKWVVVAKEVQEAASSYGDFVRAMKDYLVSVGSLDEFADLFVPRDQITRWLTSRTDTLLHKVGYVPQRLASGDLDGVPAIDTVLDWVKGRRTSKLAFIHAPAGHGKTIFLERLAKQLLSMGRTDKSTPTPFLLKFADHRRANNIDELSMHALHDIGRGDVPVNALKDLVRRGRILLLFDGLDELSEEVGERIGVENFRALADLIRRDSEGRVLVTCRSTFLRSRQSVADHLLSGDHEVWELLPFDDEDQRKFLEQNPPDGISGGVAINRHRDRVLGFVNRNPIVADFATSPFLLKQISLAVAENATALPRNMADVYNRFILSLCEREIKRQAHGISAERQAAFLRRVAHEMVYDQEYSYPQDLFELLIDDEFDGEIRSAPAPAARRKELVTKLMGHAAFGPVGSQRSTLACEIQFLHESLRDYGAASYLVNLLAAAIPDAEFVRSAICRRSLPEGVIAFMSDSLDARGVSALGQIALRTPPLMDNQNLFRIAVASPVLDAPSLAFALRKGTGMSLPGITIEDAGLQGFVFDHTDFTGTRFTSCDLSGCLFELSALNGTMFLDCDLTGARFPSTHGVAQVDDVLATEGHDVTAALLARGALVGGRGRESVRGSAVRNHDGRGLTEHVLRKFYNGTNAANARRRARGSDILERGRAGEERVRIREIVVPTLVSEGVLEESQRGVHTSLTVTREANAEVVRFLFRQSITDRLERVIRRANENAPAN